MYSVLSDIRKAFLYFKKCRHYVFHSLATNGGSFLALPHDGGMDLPVDQLNEANDEGVCYAKANYWDDVENNEE